MLRPILFLHLWLGLLVGLIMTIWCLSGFVMMYSPYPRLQPEEQLRGLTPLQLPPDIDWNRVSLADDVLLSTARIEQIGNRLVLRVTPAAEPVRPIWDLVVIPFLAMVTLVCTTGTWMGLDKIRRDLRPIRNRRRHAQHARLQGVKA